MAVDTSARTEVKHYKNYIGGEWVDRDSKVDVANPFDGSVVFYA